MKQSDQVMNTIEDQNASPRKLTSLERGQIRLKFIEMNEKPEKFEERLDVYLDEAQQYLDYLN